MREGQAPIYSVFYHRVADEYPNPWTISCREFERQIDYMQSRFELIGLDELQRRVREGNSTQPAVAITFDDGYAENCRFALPLLMQRKIPCTYFVTTGHVLSGKPFSHDIARGVPLPINSAEELRAAANGGIEIGLHTRTHIDLANVFDTKILNREIKDANAELEDMIGRRVRYFAFPYGLPQQMTQSAIDVIQETGLEGFCSAFGAYNFPGRNSFHIRRFHADPDFSRLQNWLDFDSRKVRIEPYVPYHLSSTKSIPQTISR